MQVRKYASQSNRAAQIILCALMLLLSVEKAGAQGGRVPTNINARLDNLVAQLVRVNEFSGNVLIRRNGQTLTERSYGYANREFRIPNNAHTRFLIGSISKQFTAAAILLLQQQGKLSVDDKLAKYVPDFPSGDKITLLMLLTHRSGISRDLPGPAVNYALPHTPLEMVEIIKRDSLVFPPGTSSAYSNNAFRILAYIIESVSGRSYSSFLKTAFFEPLGMGDTGQLEEASYVPMLAEGYTPGFGPDGYGKAAHLDISNGVGPGSLYSTVSDLAKWNENFLIRHTLYPEVAKGLESGGGVGVVVDSVAGRTRIWHNGVYQGFTALSENFPELGITVVYLGNTETLASEGPFQREVSSLVVGAPTKPLAGHAYSHLPPGSDQTEFTGLYRFSPWLAIRVQMRGAQPILEGLPLECGANDRCYYRLKGADVKFVRDSAHRVTGMDWTDPAGTFHADKESQ